MNGHEFHDRLHALLVEAGVSEPRFIERIEYRVNEGTTIWYRKADGFGGNRKFAFDDGRRVYTSRVIPYSAEEIE